MTEQQLIAAGFVKDENGEWRKLRKIYEADHLPSSPKPEQAVRNVALAKAQREKKNPSRRKVSIVSFRRRLIDPDNLCGKYFIDALRYNKIVDDDTAKHIVLEVRQEKSDEPRTEIEITPL